MCGADMLPQGSGSARSEDRGGEDATIREAHSSPGTAAKSKNWSSLMGKVNSGASDVESVSVRDDNRDVGPGNPPVSNDSTPRMTAALTGSSVASTPEAGRDFGETTEAARPAALTTLSCFTDGSFEKRSTSPTASLGLLHVRKQRPALGSLSMSSVTELGDTDAMLGAADTTPTPLGAVVSQPRASTCRFGVAEESEDDIHDIHASRCSSSSGLMDANVVTNYVGQAMLSGDDPSDHHSDLGGDQARPLRQASNDSAAAAFAAAPPARASSGAPLPKLGVAAQSSTRQSDPSTLSSQSIGFSAGDGRKSSATSAKEGVLTSLVTELGGEVRLSISAPPRHVSTGKVVEAESSEGFNGKWSSSSGGVVKKPTAPSIDVSSELHSDADGDLTSSDGAVIAAVTSPASASSGGLPPKPKSRGAIAADRPSSASTTSCQSVPNAASGSRCGSPEEGQAPWTPKGTLRSRSSSRDSRNNKRDSRLRAAGFGLRSP